MSFSYLTDEIISNLFNASVLAGFNDNEALRSLREGINPFFKGQLPASGDNASSTLNRTLLKLNTTQKLVGGEVPFLIWLRNAARLTTGQKEGEVFRDALNRIGSTAAAEPNVGEAMAIPELDPVVLEQVIFYNDMVPFGFLRQGHQAGLSVARVEVPRYDDGHLSVINGGEPNMYRGTGWLLTQDLLMTNQHVIKARADKEQPAISDIELQVKASIARFDYEATTSTGTPVKVQKLEAADISLDYALLRLKEPPMSAPVTAGEAPKRKALRLAKQQLMLDAGSSKRIPVNIIQHPDGDPKKLACRNNLVSMGDERDLRYFTDTRLGSSGSPVFDDNWIVVALHRGSQDVKGVFLHGRPVPWVNVGTQITVIMAHLQHVNPDVFNEIATAQAELGAPGW